MRRGATAFSFCVFAELFDTFKPTISTMSAIRHFLGFILPYVHNLPSQLGHPRIRQALSEGFGHFGNQAFLWRFGSEVWGEWCETM